MKSKGIDWHYAAHTWGMVVPAALVVMLMVAAIIVSVWGMP